MDATELQALAWLLPRVDALRSASKCQHLADVPALARQAYVAASPFLGLLRAALAHSGQPEGLLWVSCPIFADHLKHGSCLWQTHCAFLLEDTVTSAGWRYPLAS